MQGLGRKDRQYLFRRRLDRRWVAKRLAAGMRVEQIAAVERAHEAGVRLLLEDRSFQRLLGGWRAHQALGEAERLARLTALAVDVLELALIGGDRKAALFLIDERRAGRHPGRTLAEAVEKRMRKAGDPGWRRPEPPARPAPEPLVRLPAAEVEAAVADPEIQAEQAAADLSRHLSRIRQGLVARLEGELEREITAGARPHDAILAAGLADMAAWGAAHDAAAEAAEPAPAARRPETPAPARQVRHHLAWRIRALLDQRWRELAQDGGLSELAPGAGRIFHDAYEAMGP